MISKIIKMLGNLGSSVPMDATVMNHPASSPSRSVHPASILPQKAQGVKTSTALLILSGSASPLGSSPSDIKYVVYVIMHQLPDLKKYNGNVGFGCSR